MYRVLGLGFPKIRVTFLGVPIKNGDRILGVYVGAWGPVIQGNYQVELGCFSKKHGRFTSTSWVYTASKNLISFGRSAKGSLFHWARATFV